MSAAPRMETMNECEDGFERTDCQTLTMEMTCQIRHNGRGAREASQRDSLE